LLDFKVFTNFLSREMDKEKLLNLSDGILA